MSSLLNDNFPLDNALRILEQHPMCDHCLGRQFALFGTATSNADRGASIKLILTLQGDRLIEMGKLEQGSSILKLLSTAGRFLPAQATLKKRGIEVDCPNTPCFICNDAFAKIPDVVSRFAAAVHDYQYENFIAGSKIPLAMVEREDQLRMQLQLAWGEAMKREINRELGKAFTNATGKPVEFDTPQMTLVWDLEKHAVEISPSAVFLLGRYNKLIRGIPQTRWPCTACDGQGCSECQGTGKRYATSVEEEIRDPILAAFGAKDGKFHGAGREDIDARMLGNGRPFVFEVIMPHARQADLDKIEATVNEKSAGVVEIHNLGYSHALTMQKLKALASISSKTYKARIAVDHPISDAQLASLDKALASVTIQQRTPLRVQHRRADLLRTKKVYSCKSMYIDELHFISEIHCQGGLYIKELISGDGGRTTPSMTELLGVQAVCEELDVTEVNTEVSENGQEPTRHSP